MELQSAIAISEGVEHMDLEAGTTRSREVHKNIRGAAHQIADKNDQTRVELTIAPCDNQARTHTDGAASRVREARGTSVDANVRRCTLLLQHANDIIIILARSPWAP